MANWTKRDDISGSIFSNEVVSDGSTIYYLRNSSQDVYQYSFGTPDTDTLIITGSTYPVDSIVWFNNSLYFLMQNAGDTEVYRWNGTLDNVTLVDTITGITAARTLWANDTVMVNYARGGIGSYAPVTHYSSNGSSWSTGSFQTYNSAHTGPDNDDIHRTRGAFSIYDRFCVTAAPCSTYVLFEFDSGSGQWDIVTDPSTKSPEMTGPDVIWTDINEYTTDFVAFNIPATSVDDHVPAWNFPYSTGSKINGSNSEIYKFEVDNWVLLDTVTGLDFYLGDPTFVRTTDGNAYALVEISGNWEIWERDEAIDPPAVADEFWYGVNNPLYQSDLPFKLGTPDAAILNSTDLAALGANAPQPNIILGSGAYQLWSTLEAAQGNTKTQRITSMRWLFPCQEDVGEPTGGISLPTNTGETITITPPHISQPGTDTTNWVFHPPQNPGDPPYWGPGGGVWTQIGNDIHYNQGLVGIGTSQPQGILHCLFESSEVYYETNRNAANGATFNLHKARGVPGSPLPATFGDTAGTVRGRVYNGSSYQTIANFRLGAAALLAGKYSGDFQVRLAQLDGTVQRMMWMYYDGRVQFKITGSGLPPQGQLHVAQDDPIAEVPVIYATQSNSEHYVLEGVTTDLDTNEVVDLASFVLNSDNAPTAGFGPRIRLGGKSDTINDQNMFWLYSTWIDSTHGTRSSRADFSTFFADTERVSISLGSNSTNALLSFFNVPLAPQQAHIPNPTGGAVVDAEARSAINSILSILETFGFKATS